MKKYQDHLKYLASDQNMSSKIVCIQKMKKHQKHDLQKKKNSDKFIKVKNFFPIKHTAQKIKCKLQTSRKSLQKMSNEELIHKIYKELLK